MAQGNTTLAIDVETRDRLNDFVKKYNKANPQAKEMTAKNFIALALDYFQRTGADITSDGAETLPAQNEMIAKLDSILKGIVDVNLKTTAIGQGLTTIHDNQVKQIEGTQENILLLTTKRYVLNKDEKDMEYDNLTKLGEVLKAWRLKRGLSAYKASESMKINYRVLRNIELGKDVYLRSFLRYANYIESNDSEFNVWTYYKCWACAFDENLKNIERNEKRSQIETWLKLAEPKGE